MDSPLQGLVESRQFSADEITAKTKHIYQTILDQSLCLDSGNFTRINPADLERLFELYDQAFFEEQCRQALGSMPLFFRLSKRMTSTAGQTARYSLRNDPAAVNYKITISSTLLFQTFHDGDREVTVNGVVCRDRLEALQRIFEHELIHLVEMLVWMKSSCAAERFQSLVSRLFGHTDHRHQLITPAERAFTAFGIRTGDAVHFVFEGVEYVGTVNKITKRATVLVENQQGTRYSDGKHYKKFYVPVRMLEKVSLRTASPGPPLA